MKKIMIGQAVYGLNHEIWDLLSMEQSANPYITTLIFNVACLNRHTVNTTCQT